MVFSFLIMHVCVSVCGYVHMSASALAGQKGLSEAPGAGVKGSCELPIVGAEN